MLAAMLLLHAVLVAIILAFGRGILALLRVLGIESWGLSFVLAIVLGVLTCPTLVAGHGVGLLPWILSPGDFGWAIFASPVTSFIAWFAMGQPFPASQTGIRSQTFPKPAHMAPVLKFPDDDLLP